MIRQNRVLRRSGFVTSVLACAVVATTPVAADHETTSEEPIEEMRVVYPPPAMLVTPLPSEVMQSGRARNLSDAVGDVPGIDGIRRGANGLEPVVRGLGWERVPVEVDGLPIMGAGPGRMDTPATLFGPAALQRVEVFKGLGSVTLGPGGTGGRIRISTDYERTPEEIEEEAQIHGEARTTFDSIGNRFAGLAFVQGGTEKLDAHLGVDGFESHDYDAADGTEVPNSAKAASGVLSLGYRPTPNQRVWGNYVDANFWDEDFPSLPMDVDRGSVRIGSLGHRWRNDEGLVAETRLRGGYSGARHRMNNDNKPNPMMPMLLSAKVKGDADSYYAAADSELRVPPLFGTDVRVKTGTDFNYLARDATRTREMMMMGMTMEALDHLWPDVAQWNLGVFVEAEIDLNPEWRIRIGGRYDRAEADADDADDASLLNSTVRENYVRFHGDAAADVSRTDDVGATNLLIEWQPTNGLRFYTGTGIVARAPSTSERYFAFAVTPGGLDIGNPTLDPEVKTEVEVGALWQHDYFSASVQAYHHWIDDYILRTMVALTDVDGDLNPDRIRSYVNTRARLYGVEANFTPRPLHWLSFPVTLAYTRGRDVKADEDLPEIPPLEVRVAVRMEGDAPTPWWTEFGVRVTAKQDEVSEAFGENETDGYEVVHLRGGIAAAYGIHLELGIENLFDEEYNYHLTREVPVPVGDLAAGDEVPAPGRSIYGTIRWTF